jgi:uncharacterized protein YjbI with pentapeptide repeats
MPTRRAHSTRSSRTTPTAPAIEPLRLMDLEPADADRLQPDLRAEGLRIEGADLSGRDLTGLVTDECELVGMRADHLILDAARMLETRIDHLDAPVLDARRATLRDVEVLSSRIGAFEGFDAGLEAVRIVDAKLGWVNLRGAKLVNVVFEGCRFDELDLTDAAATRVAFHDCHAASVAFAHAHLQDVDLRGLEFSSLSNLDGMAGATLSTQQATMLATDLAAHLGIQVKD